MAVYFKPATNANYGVVAPPPARLKFRVRERALVIFVRSQHFLSSRLAGQQRLATLQ